MSPSSLTAHEKREFASELKFTIDAGLAERVKAWARARLIADPNAQGYVGDTYSVTSIYLDTEALDVFHRRGLHRHSKFRVRRYGGTTLFFERKLKIRGRLAKRRTPVTPEDIAVLASGQAVDAAWLGRWFQQKISGRALRPQCQIDYERTARVQMTPAGPIRLTLDEAIRARPASDLHFCDVSHAAPVTEKVVLELKYRGELPALFRELVETFSLNPLSFSKYRAALPVLGLVESPESARVEREKIALCPTS